MPKPKPLKIEMLPVAELMRYPENPRTHSAEQVAQINGNIGAFGWTTPILIDAQGAVIDGHGRLQAVEQRGMDTVPVIRLAHLSPEQARAYRIADNRLTELGGWDHGLLSAELEALRAADFDLELTGFDWQALEDLMAAEDAQGTDDDAPGTVDDQGRATNGKSGPCNARRVDTSSAPEPATLQSPRRSRRQPPARVPLLRHFPPFKGKRIKTMARKATP